MKTIFVRLVNKKSYLFHHPLSGTECFTLSIPPSKSGEVFEVLDLPEIRARIYPEKILEEVKDPKDYNKLGDKPGDCTFVETDQVVKARLAKERKAMEGEPKAADKGDGKPKPKEKANEPK